MSRLVIITLRPHFPSPGSLFFNFQKKKSRRISKKFVWLAAGYEVSFARDLSCPECRVRDVAFDDRQLRHVTDEMSAVCMNMKMTHFYLVSLASVFFFSCQLFFFENGLHPSEFLALQTFAHLFQRIENHVFQVIRDVTPSRPYNKFG